MTAIKPPAGPAGPGGIDAPGSAGPTGPSTGVSFRDLVEGPPGPTSPPAPDPTRAVIADLTAGRLAPDQAVQQLVTLALQQAGTPAAMRPAVEQRLRELLSRDPLLADLVRQVGAKGVEG